jgi:hypothetical protein
VYKVELTSVGCGFGQEPYDHFTGIQQTYHFVARCFVIVHFAAAVRGKSARQKEPPKGETTTQDWTTTTTQQPAQQNTQQLWNTQAIISTP